MEEVYIDPVCGAYVTPNSAQAVSEEDGRLYYFDSVECKVAFDREPERYIAKS
jgi:YHS domain-containing protein